jgi:hypothetical protein
MPEHSFGVGGGVFEKFSCQVLPRRGSGIQSLPVGFNFQLFAGKSRQTELGKFDLSSVINGTKMKIVMRSYH